MKKRELIQAFEKASGQTRCEANRVLDLLSGVPGDPFAKIKPPGRKPPEHPPLKIGKTPEGTPDER